MMRMLASRACTIKELAQEFGISSRQVRRDLEEIEAEGHPLTASDEPGEKLWQLPLGYKGLPPVALNRYELMSLQLARANLSHLRGTPFLDDLDAVIAKVAAALPAKTANHLERIIKVFMPLQRGTRSYATKNSLLRDLRTALLLQRTVEFTYKKPYTDKPVTYRVDPYELLLYDHGLYIAGYSHQSRSERLFLVDRLRDIRLTEDRFEIPPSYSARDRYGKQFGLIDEPPQEVKIWFSPDVAHLMKERQWHPTQQVKNGKDGSVEVTMHAGGLDEIAWWVLSWGKEAKVLSPPKLVRIIKDCLIKALNRYSQLKA
jgi:predicted DNA-binding transcriptional regulator YafY